MRYFQCESYKTSTQTFSTTTKRKDTMIKSMGSRRYSCIVRSFCCCCYCYLPNELLSCSRSSHASLSLPLSSSMLFLLFLTHRLSSFAFRLWRWRPCRVRFRGICVSVSQCPSLCVSVRLCACVFAFVCMCCIVGQQIPTKKLSPILNEFNARLASQSVCLHFNSQWQHWQQLYIPINGYKLKLLQVSVF